MLLAHCALCSAAESSELREAGAGAWGCLVRVGGPATLPAASGALAALLKDASLHVRAAAAAALAAALRTPRGSPPHPATLQVARDSLEALVAIVTKDAPSSALRGAANSALGVRLSGEGKGRGGPRAAVLECCSSREGGKFLESYWDKVLQKVVLEEEGGKEEEFE